MSHVEEIFKFLKIKVNKLMKYSLIISVIYLIAMNIVFYQSLKGPSIIVAILSIAFSVFFFVYVAVYIFEVYKINLAEENLVQKNLFKRQIFIVSCTLIFGLALTYKVVQSSEILSFKVRNVNQEATKIMGTR